MKLIIAGSRDLTPSTDYLELLGLSPEEVVCGMARGAHLWGKVWAERFGLPVKEFPADWEKYGKFAGFVRNAEMAKYADELLAIWDGKSRGTKHIIQLMLDLGKPFQVILIRP